MKRRVLVTGGAGFIGSHVADAFLAAGSDVTVIDNLSRGRPQQVPRAAEFRQLDVGSEEARALVAGGQFEVIVHLAAQVDVRVSVSDPVFDAEENLLALLSPDRAIGGHATRTAAERSIRSRAQGRSSGDLTRGEPS